MTACKWVATPLWEKWLSKEWRAGLYTDKLGDLRIEIGRSTKIRKISILSGPVKDLLKWYSRLNFYSAFCLFFLNNIISEKSEFSVKNQWLRSCFMKSCFCTYFNERSIPYAAVPVLSLVFSVADLKLGSIVYHTPYDNLRSGIKSGTPADILQGNKCAFKTRFFGFFSSECCIWGKCFKQKLFLL